MLHGNKVVEAKEMERASFAAMMPTDLGAEVSMICLFRLRAKLLHLAHENRISA